VDRIQQRFGRTVRRLRESRGWTQEELATRSGKHWTYIGGIERGERNPTLRVIVAIAKALSVPSGDLLSDLRGSR